LHKSSFWGHGTGEDLQDDVATIKTFYLEELFDEDDVKEVKSHGFDAKQFPNFVIEALLQTWVSVDSLIGWRDRHKNLSYRTVLAQMARKLLLALVFAASHDIQLNTLAQPLRTELIP